MPEFTVLSRFDPTTGRQTNQFSEAPCNIVWRGEANNFDEAKEKAGAACMRRVKPEDMKAYFATEKEVKWG